MNFLNLLALVSCISYALAFPTDEHLVAVSSTEATKEGTSTEDRVPQAVAPPQLYEMDVVANVSNRFGKTLITSKVRNPAARPQEVTFSVILPDSAYISEFIMEIGGKQYKAYVKEKEEAKQIYNQAVASGIGAAHVAVSARDSNRFTVSVNVEAEGKAIFYLTYEELLERKNDMYEIVINIHPGQIVKHLGIKVNITEGKTLRFVKTPALRSGNEIVKNEAGLEPNTEVNVNGSSAVVTFNPDIEQQRQFAENLGTEKENGLSGQFVVQYDVDRSSGGGQVLIKDGYFVHFFAPQGLEPIPKHVVFVLDRSGSMAGLKMEKLKDAMNLILSELNPLDAFSVVDFDDKVRIWDIPKEEYELVGESPLEKLTSHYDSTSVKGNLVTVDTIKVAKKMLERMTIGFSTNIIGGLEAGMFILNNTKYQPMLIFLTDGAPNVRFWKSEDIINEVAKLRSTSVDIPIFSLSFGEDADKKFLRELSLKNFAFSRHIYVAADADLQLQDFYHEISSPLISNVQFKYVDKVENVTKTTFPIVFDGGEIVVAGRYPTDFSPEFDPEILGTSFHGKSSFLPVVEHSITELERLWAYLTIRQKLEARDAADNKEELEKEALDLALKYSFVTPVSSLVVVKPNDTSSVDTEDASTKKFNHYDSSWLLSGGSVPLSAKLPLGDYDYDDRIAGNSNSGATDIRIQEEPEIPFFGPTVPTTTAFSTPKSVISNVMTVEELKARLPWLANVLDANEKFEVQGKSYKLGFGEEANSGAKCTNSPAGGEGNCVLLHECPQAYQHLDDFAKYETSFCPLNEYAGICCSNWHDPSAIVFS